YGRVRIVVEIAGDVGRLGIAEDALELLLGGALYSAVDLVLRGRTFGDKLEVDDRHVRGWHPDGNAVELAGELRQHESNGFCGAGGGRDHVDRGSARPVEVLVYLVERGLVVRVGMHRGHKTLVDADRIIEHLRDRREAVGGARGIGDDL